MTKTVAVAESKSASAAVIDEHHEIIPVLLRLDENDLKMLDRAARKKGLSRTDALRAAARMWSRRML